MNRLSQEFNLLIKNKRTCVAVYVFSLFFAISCILPSTINQGAAFALLASIIVGFPLALLSGVILSAINVLQAQGGGQH